MSLDLTVRVCLVLRKNSKAYMLLYIDIELMFHAEWDGREGTTTTEKPN